MPGDINIKLGAEASLDTFVKALKEIIADVDILKEAFKVVPLDISKGEKEMAKLFNELTKAQKTVEKTVQQQREQGGILGGLIQKQKELRSAQKAATSPKELEQYSRQLKTVTNEISNAKGATNTWGKALGSFQFKFNALGNIAANIVSRITLGFRNFIKASWDAALAISAVENAFKKLDRPGLLRELQKATQGAVSDLQLMQYAIKANNFRIPLKDLATYFEFATKRANETGESVDYLVESILLGLGRESVKILDNLGISAVQLQKEAKVLGSVGAAAAKIIKEELANMGDVVVSEATKIQSLSITFQRIGTNLGKIFTKAFGESASKISKWIEWLATDVVGEFGKESLETFKKGFEDWETIPVEDKIKIINSEIERFKTNIKQTNQYLAEFNTPKSLQDLKEDPFGRKEAEKKRIAKELLIQSQAQLQAYTEELSVLTKSSKVKTAEIGILEGINEELETLTMLRQKATSEDMVKQYSKEIEALEKYRQELLNVNEAQRVVHDEGLQRIQGITKAQVTSDAKIQESSEQVRETRETTENPPDKLDPVEVAKETMTAVSDLYDTWGKLIEANKQKELSAAGDNAKKREEIEKAYLKKQQRFAIGQAWINTALGVTEIWSKYAENPVVAAILTAIHMAKMIGEIAIIKAQKFGKGGLIEGQKHSQGGKMIEAEGGEFITNAKSTRKYKSLLEAINEDKEHKVWNALNLELNRKQIKPNRETDYTQKLYEFIKNEMPHAYETQEYFVIERGNQTVKIHKKAS